jgi:hypothetical protein
MNPPTGTGRRPITCTSVMAAYLDQVITEKRSPAMRRFLPHQRKCNRFAPLLALVALVAGGCGDGARPEDTVRSYFTAIVDGNGERACGQLTARLRREIDRAPAARRAGRTCVEVMQLAAGLNPDLGREDIESIAVEVQEQDDRATARLRNPLVGRRERIDLLKIQGEWRIDTLETRPRLDASDLRVGA